jgi:hypothetical protein
MRSFEWTDDDERVVSGFMQRVAALPSLAPMRDPMQLWWKAQLLQRWDASRRVQAPLDVAERVEIVAGLVAAGVLVTWAAPTVGRLLAEPLRQLIG